MRFARPFVCALIAILVVGCGATSNMTNSLMGMAETSPQLTEFASLAKSAGLDDELKGNPLLTVFAPTNAAFKKLSPDVLAGLQNPENQARLASVLQNHIVSGSIAPDGLVPGPLVNELGTKLQITQDAAGRVEVNGANVIQSIKAVNGYVHMIDDVLMPAS